MTTELRIDEVLKRIDVYGRLAYGGQIVAAMAMIAAPILFVTCIVLLFTRWDDGEAQALLLGLGGAALAVVVEVGGVAFAVFCWRWSGDWITEWPGYAAGIAIAVGALGALAWLLMETPLPIPASFAITIGAAFGVGVLIAGNLAGVQVLDDQRRTRGRVARRR